METGKRNFDVSGGQDQAVYLRKADSKDLHEVQRAFERSREFLEPWSYPPTDYGKYIAQPHLYLLCLRSTQAILGSFNISGVIFGHFHSGYLGYQVFVPYQGKGYMGQGIRLLLKEAFETLNLHRLEANIQPGNSASIALVKKAGFRKEGFSPKYLRIGGSWKDHERWAVINDNWQEKS